MIYNRGKERLSDNNVRLMRAFFGEGLSKERIIYEKKENIFPNGCFLCFSML